MIYHIDFCFKVLGFGLVIVRFVEKSTGMVNCLVNCLRGFGCFEKGMSGIWIGWSYRIGGGVFLLGVDWFSRCGIIEESR